MLIYCCNGAFADVLFTLLLTEIFNQLAKYWLSIGLPSLHSMPLLGSRRNIAVTFGTERLEWCGYPMVKKIEDTFIHFVRVHERDGQMDRRTDRHRTTA